MRPYLSQNHSAGSGTLYVYKFPNSSTVLYKDDIVKMDTISKKISSFATGGGSNVIATCTEHGFNSGDSITITNSSYYNGTYILSAADTNTFTFSISGGWVVTDTANVKGTLTEYIVTNNPSVVSSATGHATITISPTLIASSIKDTPLLTADSRTIHPSMRTSVAAENATMGYFFEFDFTIVKRINRFSAGIGSTVVVTCPSHGFSNGNSITISGTRNYNGTHTISSVTTDTFTISYPTTYSVISGFKKHSATYVEATSTAHGFNTDQQITIYDVAGDGDTSAYNGTYTITDATDNTNFFRFPATYTVTGTAKAKFAVLQEAGLAEKPNISYVTTMQHSITWDSKLFLGIGGVITFDNLVENRDHSAQGVDITLSGVDTSVISQILNTSHRGRNVKIWHAHFSNGSIISDPVLVFWGKMNGGFEIQETRDEISPGTVTIRGRMEDALASLEVVNGILTNTSSHQHYFKGDKFFDFVPKLVGKQIEWGKPEKVKMQGGSKGCGVSLILAISLNLSDNCDILNNFRYFRDNYVCKTHEDLIKQYYRLSETIGNNPSYFNKNLCDYLVNKYLIKINTNIINKNNTEALKDTKKFISCMDKLSNV